MGEASVRSKTLRVSVSGQPVGKVARQKAQPSRQFRTPVQARQQRWSKKRQVTSRQQQALRRAGVAFQGLFNRFTPEELETIGKHVWHALEHPTANSEHARFVQEFAGSRAYSPKERASLRFETLIRSFQLRNELLQDTLTASQVAKILGSTRQTPHDRVKSGSLLAVVDKGAWRFPSWQFDPQGPDRVVEGLPEVIRALDMSPLAKINWFIRPNSYLEGRRPIDALRQGDVGRVLDIAAGTGPR